MKAYYENRGDMLNFQCESPVSMEVHAEKDGGITLLIFEYGEKAMINLSHGWGMILKGFLEEKLEHKS